LIEVELKFELSSESQFKLQEKLQSMQFNFKVHNLDVYYDTEKFELLQKAVFVRVRNKSQLQFKFNNKVDIAHVQSIERVIPLQNCQNFAEKMNNLFTSFLPSWFATSDFETAIIKNGLIELATIQNIREVYSKDDFYLSIDHVKELGDFVEVEIRCEEDSNTNEALDKVQAFASEIAIKPIRIGYVEMWLSIHNPAAYRLSKYHL